jgi:ribosomal protein S18 acetylase RimI-like enzyme
MNNVVVREATNKDINGIIEVLKSIHLQNEVWTREALQKLLATKDYVILVAELNGAVIGFIDFYVLPSVYEKWNEATINNFFVHRSHQNKGVGSKLLTEAVKRADEMGLGEFSVGTEKDNQRAINLYKKHGFDKEYLMLQRTKEPEQFSFASLNAFVT